MSRGVLSTSDYYLKKKIHDDDDGSGNVAKEMNLRSFKLYRVHLDSLNMLMQKTFPEDEFLRILFKFKKRKENSSSYVHVLQKT